MEEKQDKRPSKSRKTLQIISRIFGAIVTLGTIGVLLTAAVFVVPRFFDITPYIVESGSMEPEISSGAVAFVDGKMTTPEIGDIITYKLEDPSDAKNIGKGDTSEDDVIETDNNSFLAKLIAPQGTFVTHRVNDIVDGLYIMKGDANDVVDARPVKPEQIVGTYKFQIPKAGHIMAKMEAKLIVVIIIWIIFFNFLSILFSSLVEDKKEKTDKNDPAADSK
ncbi:MAG: hypothetical protein IJ571_06560 [Ruminococcus sp.]|nr:hypothetical protein [Ruminococcus sp.]